MGSFLMTCSLTSQSIQEGETVYVIPIVQKKSYSPVILKDGRQIFTVEPGVYSTDMHEPFGFMFEATYADYGNYDIVWNDLNKCNFELFYKALKQRLLPVKQGDNKNHEPEVNLQDIEFTSEDVYQNTWVEVQKAIKCNRLLVDSIFNNAILQVDLFVIHKDHTDTLVSIYVNKDVENSYFYKKNPERITFFKASFEERYNIFIKDTDDTGYEEELNDLLKRRKELNTDETRRYFSLIRQDSREILEKHFLSNSGSGLTSTIYAIDIEKYIKESKENIQKDLYIYFNKLKTIFLAMSSLNIKPRPVYYGSQDYSNAQGIVFAEFMKKVQEYNIEKFKEDPDMEIDPQKRIDYYLKTMDY